MNKFVNRLSYITKFILGSEVKEVKPKKKRKMIKKIVKRKK